MERFIYSSKEFWDGLRNNAHHAGEVEFLRSIARPGMRVMDIGANRGVTTVALAKQVGSSGRVYAFEPVPEYYAELRSNLSCNGVDNVSTYMLALSDRTGRMGFYKHGEGSGITPTEDATETWVEATTLANFLAEHRIAGIDLMNMDCEGSELFALQGAQAILQGQAPRIFCEIHHGYLRELGQSAEGVVRLLGKIGYDVRPIQVVELHAETSLRECSHIYARKRSRQDSSKRVEREMARGRTPAGEWWHRTTPAGRPVAGGEQ